MRLFFVSVLVLIVGSCPAAIAWQRIFPADMHAYPLLFHYYLADENLTDEQTAYYTPDAEARNIRIVKFISRYTEKAHCLIQRSQTGLYDAIVYKYLITYRLVEILPHELPTNTTPVQDHPAVTKRFAPCFTIVDRQTGYSFQPYYPYPDREAGRGTIGEAATSPPEDRDFFRDLGKAISSLQATGKLPEEDGRTRPQVSRESLIATGIISTFLFSGSYGVLWYLHNNS